MYRPDFLKEAICCNLSFLLRLGDWLFPKSVMVLFMDFQQSQDTTLFQQNVFRKHILHKYTWWHPFIVPCTCLKHHSGSWTQNRTTPMQVPPIHIISNTVKIIDFQCTSTKIIFCWKSICIVQMIDLAALFIWARSIKSFCFW